MERCARARVRRSLRGASLTLRHRASACVRPVQPVDEATPLARRQSPQTFEKRRREQAKKQKKAAKQEARVWRNAEKRDAKLREEDPDAWRRLQEQRRRDEEQWYYG